MAAIPRLTRIVLRYIKEGGFKSGMSKANKAGIKGHHITEARKIALKDPRKHLPDWHFMAKAEESLKAERMFNMRHKRGMDPYKFGQPSRDTIGGRIADNPTPPELARRFNAQEQTLLAKYPEYRKKYLDMVRKTMKEHAQRSKWGPTKKTFAQRKLDRIKAAERARMLGGGRTSRQQNAEVAGTVDDSRRTLFGKDWGN